MRRQTALTRTQLVLPLEREAAAPPIAPGSKALLQAVADLLLGALGSGMEEASGRGDAHEPEDRA
jgi:hypothetical protein